MTLLEAIGLAILPLISPYVFLIMALLISISLETKPNNTFSNDLYDLLKPNEQL